jgi:type IX secretion system PorP/SprF family membrane protein
MLGWILSNSIMAQDIHFSQYLNSPLNLNPALSGFHDSKFRFILNHRNQWSSVTVPYKTYSASADMQIWKRKRQSDMFGLGIIFNNDQAGDSHYGTTQGAISVSYVKALNRNNRNLLAFGAQAFYSQRSIDYSQLYFPNQWNGNSYDPNRQTGENFTVNSFSYFDISAGIHWFSIMNSKLRFNSGLSVWHINQPAQSLMNDNSINLDIKYLLYSEAQIDLDRINALFPSIYYAHQGPYNELTFGLRYQFVVHPNKQNYTAMHLGVFARNADALIIQLGMDYKKFRIAGSYDLNYSTLHVASNYMGGFEISVMFFLDRHKTKKPSGMPCPIF